MNTESYLYEWSISQWAEAAAWYEGRKELPEPVLESAWILRNAWDDFRVDHPTESPYLADVVKPMNWRWASALWRNAIGRV